MRSMTAAFSSLFMVLVRSLLENANARTGRASRERAASRPDLRGTACPGLTAAGGLGQGALGTRLRRERRLLHDVARARRVDLDARPHRRGERDRVDVLAL